MINVVSPFKYSRSPIVSTVHFNLVFRASRWNKPHFYLLCLGKVTLLNDNFWPTLQTMWVQIVLSVLLALKPPHHISFPLSFCWLFVVLGPLLGEPLSDQLRHIIKCCKHDYQELNKKRNSHAEAHRPKSGEERPVWFVHWPRTPPCTDYECKA